MKLSQNNLPVIAKNLPCPNYDRESMISGIIHIGVGGFHRSHQAFYMHQLLENFQTPEWSICGVGLREADRHLSEILISQDCLYTLVTQYPDGTEKSEVVGSIGEYLLAAESPDSVINKIAHEATKVVSLTITEGGYNFNSTTGEFDFTNPDIQHELAHPNSPRTIYGYLTAALRKRRSKGLPPVTILSCDNIQHNGNMARKMVLAFAAAQDPELALWIEKNVSFPNSMVDRITPVTPPEMIEYLEDKYGLEDKWPVVCEPFIQWVIEDNFCNGRPPLEKVGVQFVPDVTPYETMKIRLLNAGHSVLGIPGAIHGHSTIDACMLDPIFKKFMRQFMDSEVTPILGTVEGIDIEKYKDNLEERFANPNIKDSVSRICAESSAKLPKFLIPTLRENLARQGSIRYATFVLAAWCYYSDKAINEKGFPLEILDARKAELHEAAMHTEENWIAFLEQPEIFGDLNNNERFVKEFTAAAQTIYAKNSIRSLMEEFK